MALLLLAAPLPSALAQQAPNFQAFEVRRTHASDLGLSSPVGVAYNPNADTLIVAGANGQAVEASRAGEALSQAFALPGKGVNVAVDNTGSVVAVDSATAEGAAFDSATNAVLLLEGNELVNTVSGERILLAGIGNGANRGLAVDQVSGLVYVGLPSGKAVRVFDRAGNAVKNLDLSAIEIGDQQGMAIAPSADPTDDPSVQRLYVADASGSVVEVGIEAESLAVTSAISSTASLVRTYQTSQWSPPSPDPSGVVWIPNRQQLLVSDSEVDEMKIFQNVNIWYVRPADGSIAQTANTDSFNGEPTGVGFDPAGTGRLFISNDNSGGYVDIIRPGADNSFWTADDVRSRMLLSGFPLAVDAEDVTFHQGNGHLYIVDGVGREVWDVDPGNNGTFDGGGDDIITHFDVQQYGALDPEGIGYSPATGRLVVVDDRSQSVYELETNGTLVNTINITAAGGHRMAGVTLAPASNGSGDTHLYVVDRVVDNDSDPNENDGRMYELTAPLAGGGPGNQAPVANAGPDQNISQDPPTTVTLDGTASTDDVGITGYAWTLQSGPTSAVINSPSSATTTVSITELGTYLFRLSVTDGEGLADTDDVQVVVAGAGSGTWDGAIATGSDDAEQLGDGSMRLANPDLELVVKGTDTQIVGLRFTNVGIPQGASIQSAYVQFRSQGSSTGASDLLIRAQASDNAPTFASQNSNISNRPAGSSVPWSPAAWPTDNQVGPDQRTVDISNLIEEVVGRSGWQSGNALVLIFTGSGTRIANSIEGGFATELHVVFGDGGSPTNQPPVAAAGPDQSISSATLPASASLNGSGSTDDNGITSYAWSQVDGPGTATIATPGQATTNVSLPQYGTYTFRLTVTDDGGLSDTDDVAVTVTDSSGSQTIDIPVATGTDDIEQNPNGRIIFPNGDLDLVLDSSTNMVVGVRFTNVQVPVGAVITNAYIQFRSDEVQSGPTNLVVEGQDSANAPAFTSTKFSLTNRPRTAASVAWNPDPWTANRLAGPAQRTSDLSSIISELTASGSGWASGNAMVFIITGSGKRTADSFEGGFAPRLVVEYSAP